MNEFEKYATRHCGINSLKLHDFRSQYAAYVSPTIIEERQLNVATMDVFSRLMMDRIIFLGAPIYDDAANIIQAQLLFLESADPEKDIQIYINSPGGSVTAGLGIYDTMQLVQPDVATICTGLAASMGAVLLTAGAAGKRSALPHSRVMIHQPLGGAQGQASDIEITAREIRKTKQELYEIIAAHSGAPIEKIEKDADRDYWLSAREAKEYGLIDEVLTAGAAGKRSALPHSRVMIHQPLGGAQGQASDIEITAREIRKTKQELYEIIAAHSGAPIEKIEKDADRDYWLSAREAKEYGLIDEVLTKRG